MDKLPSDVLLCIAAWLTGFDILRLGATCRRLNCLFKEEGGVWRSRGVRSPAEYILSWSVGMGRNADLSGDRGAAIVLPEEALKCLNTVLAEETGHVFPSDDDQDDDEDYEYDYETGYVQYVGRGRQEEKHAAEEPTARDPKGFSFDIWFSPVPAPEQPSAKTSRSASTSGSAPASGSSSPPSNSVNHPGGIILGAQSGSYLQDYWPHFHQQFALVSADLRLYAGFCGRNEPLDVQLKYHRWHHLAITVQVDNPVENRPLGAFPTRSKLRECIYVDGRLVQRKDGVSLHSELHICRNWQVGTGCISAGSTGKPTPEHCGWYPFAGLIDDARWWSKALSEAEVSNLFIGKVGNESSGAAEGSSGQSSSEPLSRKPLWSLKQEYAPNRFRQRRRGPKGNRGYGPFDCLLVQCTRPREHLCQQE